MANSISEMLKIGCIEQDYTLNGYFVRVYPAFSIDKVRFSFVKRNTNGKESFDIYVDTWIFQNLCDEILSGVFLKRLAKDGGDYPTAFQYTTGENASKHLAIGAGKAGLLIQGRVTGEHPQNAIVKVIATALPVGTRADDQKTAYAKNLQNGYTKLKGMARLYNIVAGNAPLAGYNKQLYCIFWNGENERKKHYHLSKEDISDPVPENSQPQPATSEAERGSINQEGLVQASATPNMEAAPAQTSAAQPMRGRFQLTQPVFDYGDMYITMINAGGAEKCLFFDKKTVERMEPVRQQALLGLKPGATIAISYINGFTYGKGTGLLFKGFAA